MKNSFKEHRVTEAVTTQTEDSIPVMIPHRLHSHHCLNTLHLFQLLRVPVSPEPGLNGVALLKYITEALLTSRKTLNNQSVQR